MLCERQQGQGKELRNDTQGCHLISPTPTSATMNILVHTHHRVICIQPWYPSRLVTTILCYTENYNNQQAYLFMKTSLLCSICCLTFCKIFLFITLAFVSLSTFLYIKQISHGRDVQIFEATCYLTAFLSSSVINIKTISCCVLSPREPSKTDRRLHITFSFVWENEARPVYICLHSHCTWNPWLCREPPVFCHLLLCFWPQFTAVNL